MDEVMDKFGDMDIPDNFVAIVTPYSQGLKVNQEAGESGNHPLIANN